MTGMSPAVPRPSNLSQAQISSIAKDFSEFVDYRPGGNLKELVSRLGGTITYHDFWGGNSPSSGSIEIKGDDIEIRLALDTGPLRDRFTIAHELGHYVLHYLYPNQVGGEKITWLTADRYGSGQVETEANWFAAAFLMPEDEFRAAFERGDGDLASVALLFGVSQQAAAVRAKVLRLS